MTNYLIKPKAICSVSTFWNIILNIFFPRDRKADLPLAIKKQYLLCVGLSVSMKIQTATSHSLLGHIWINKTQLGQSCAHGCVKNSKEFTFPLNEVTSMRVLIFQQACMSASLGLVQVSNPRDESAVAKYGPCACRTNAILLLFFPSFIPLMGFIANCFFSFFPPVLTWLSQKNRSSCLFITISKLSREKQSKSSSIAD